MDYNKLAHVLLEETRLGNLEDMPQRISEKLKSAFEAEVHQDIEKFSDGVHKDLLRFVNPLIDFMHEKGYSFFFVAGKDGTCTRHMQGKQQDIKAMIQDLAEKHEQVSEMLTDMAMELKTKSIASA